jgi:hypothetical protein
MVMPGPPANPARTAPNARSGPTAHGVAAVLTVRMAATVLTVLSAHRTAVIVPHVLNVVTDPNVVTDLSAVSAEIVPRTAVIAPRVDPVRMGQGHAATIAVADRARIARRLHHPLR